MKKLMMITASVMLILGFMTFPSFSTFGQASLPDQKQTPANVKCPDGRWVSQCVPHEWHGCADNIPC